MSKYVVTVIDTTGIQPYIFTSNRLRENIGASYLVDKATDDWVKKILEEEFKIPRNKQYEPINTSGFSAEIIYAGGGNTLLLFTSLDIAKEFTRKLSRHILIHAPGINLVAAHKEFSWNGCLFSIVQGLIDNELEQLKRAKISSSPLLGLGVTAACNSTQLPAVGMTDKYIDKDEQDRYLISRETEAKLIAGKRAIQELRIKFEPFFDNKVDDFAYRMDHLGRSRNESSYYAVIHADGNNIGKRFKSFGEEGMKANPNDPNQGYINAMRNLSKSVNNAGIKAIKKVIKSIISSIDNEGKIMGKFSLYQDEDGKKYLPFRPLIYGGDDITFICDGRMGLELAAIYLQELEQQKIADGKPLLACAGICIVKSHYPFARAYSLSEALCRNAKKFVKEEDELRGRQFSGIDWHIAASGLFGSIGEIRQREYKVSDGNLNMRPVLIQDEINQWRTWSNVTNTVIAFNEGKEWKDRRNKVIAFREKLREGKDAVKQFRTAYKIDQLPFIKGGDELALQSEGWMEESCGYFDAIEAMEFYFPLKQE
ncbi:hypothetical protein LC608_25920 [Nostoc sp. XA010]|uniref:Cas10/Cmr2 second palm domain-containing protein n=1 Tax=Nostoc sp. XA010 TaxID=2780407 RepID=UPI001E5AC089|nr:hypothetical protein [Nostoc sp. XA010]MCC5660353.1 hypothetical protein [Nostoc sp. XA010]